MADNYGPRWPLLFGSVLHVVGLMLLSVSNEYYQIFLTQCIVSGIGTSFLFYPSKKLVPPSLWSYFLTMPSYCRGRHLVQATPSACVRHHGIWIQSGRCRTSHYGPASDRATRLWVVHTHHGIPYPRASGLRQHSRQVPPPSRPEAVHPERIFRAVSRDTIPAPRRRFVLRLRRRFNFIIVEAKEAGTPTNITDYLVPIINAASIFGRIFPAHLGDVYGVFNVCIIFTLFSGVISLALWLPAASSAPIIVFAVLYGFASGLTLAIILALVASISDIQKLGHRVGTLYAFSAFGTLFGR